MIIFCHKFMKKSPIFFKFSQELYLYTMLKAVTVCHIITKNSAVRLRFDWVIDNRIAIIRLPSIAFDWLDLLFSFEVVRLTYTVWKWSFSAINSWKKVQSSSNFHRNCIIQCLSKFQVTVCHKFGWFHNQKSKWQSFEYQSEKDEIFTPEIFWRSLAEPIKL